MSVEDRARYLLKLVGNHRKTVVRDVEDDTDNFIQFDTMAEMATRSTDLESELFTETMELQRDTELEVQKIYDELLEQGESPHLAREKHVNYCRVSFGPLPPMFKALDASQPWLVYWLGNSMTLLGGEIAPEKKEAAMARLLSMQHSEGGFGGGLGQMGHAAPSYATVLAMALLGNEAVWDQIDREAIYKWMMSVKREDGGFNMHIGGEHDTRAVYCIMVLASILNIMTPELVDGTAEWLGRCQTFEGGLGGVPYDEAHGGYTFCGVAALFLIGGKDAVLKHINLEKLINWTTSRQLKLEGGFAGRSNKLVDGCYSFWVGGLVPLFDILTGYETISRASLQNYILGCCQNTQHGGLKDKPSKHADFYHTNCVLLGLSVAQHKFHIEDSPFTGPDSWAYGIRAEPCRPEVVGADEKDRVIPLNPIFGLPQGVAEKMKRHFVDK